MATELVLCVPTAQPVDVDARGSATTSTGSQMAAVERIRELTASEDRGWLAGMPWHTYVPARLEALA